MSEFDQSRLVWRKSSRSNAERECVEVAPVEGGVAVRDSKQNGRGDVLQFTSAEFAAFKRSIVIDE